MYGLVNQAIEDLLVSNYGTDVWERVCERAGVEEPNFSMMESYDDSLTYGLVMAASAELDQPVPDLLRAFGRYWMLFTVQRGYQELLSAAGRTFEEFLENLDQLHSRVLVTFPELIPPSFELVAQGGDEYVLCYRSEREGLHPMVLGLIEGLAERFGIEADIEMAEPHATGSVDFRITVKSSERTT